MAKKRDRFKLRRDELDQLHRALAAIQEELASAYVADPEAGSDNAVMNGVLMSVEALAAALLRAADQIVEDDGDRPHPEPR